MVTRINPVQYERRKLSDEVRWRLPYVDVVTVRHCDVPGSAPAKRKKISTTASPCEPNRHKVN
jgi:hypothetical protein